MMRKSLAQRFWEKVNVLMPDECWPWVGAKARRGYGMFKFGERHSQAHRVAYQFHYGVEPGDMCVLHHCDNPPCCNPAHLFLGTRYDNARDREDKGRGGRINDKLTPGEVRLIRVMYASGEYSLPRIGRIFGCTHNNVSAIILFKTWKHVTWNISEAKGGEP